MVIFGKIVVVSIFVDTLTITINLQLYNSVYTRGNQTVVCSGNHTSTVFCVELLYIGADMFNMR